MGKYLYQAILTPEEDGRYSVEFPDLPGCVSAGEDFTDAAAMAADAARTYVAAKLYYHDPIPSPTRHECPEGAESIMVFFESDSSYIITGEVVSAAEASRRLGVSPGRITHMFDAGILEGYREGRRTWITVESIEGRQAASATPGRPRKALEA